MTRREIAVRARNLQERLEEIANSYDAATSANARLLNFDGVVFEINSFYRDIAPTVSLKVFRLLEELQGLIENIRQGRPSVADEFRKKPGQTMGSLQEINLVTCCAVMTGWMKGGLSEDEAARKLAREMKKRHLQLPPFRTTAKPRSDGTLPADAIKNWRNRLLSSEKKDGDLRATYDKHLDGIRGSTSDEWRRNASNMLDVIVRK